jgi:hypothetical protein
MQNKLIEKLEQRKEQFKKGLRSSALTIAADSQ